MGSPLYEKCLKLRAPASKVCKRFHFANPERISSLANIGFAAVIQKPAVFLHIPAASISSTERHRRSMPNAPMRCLSKAAVELKNCLQPWHWLRSPLRFIVQLQ
ncbi:hypothetical protein BGLA2_1720051 [Burkholderia gladioli]|nr:hypothetical protein BGLA2_1720051 [Burkholderia gladioli]